jgi:hypothetical protein
MIFDGEGNLYGTAFRGGSGGNGLGQGVFFELSPPAIGSGSWTETVLYTFGTNSSSDGAIPCCNLVYDHAGNLYGVTEAGGNGSKSLCLSAGCGTVYEMKPPAVSGGAWTQTTIYNFGATSLTDGLQPTGLVIGAGGVLYGTTDAGGKARRGIFYKLVPPATSGGAWTEKVIYNFVSAIGDYPNILTPGKNGVMYGTALWGGTFGYGSVFSLTPVAGGSWTETLLYSFTGGIDGGQPLVGVIHDAAGNLYGATVFEGISVWGTAYELSPPAVSGGTWTETTLHGFTDGSDGASPESNLLMLNGVLYGTAANGGVGYGVVYEIVP